jgi:hypothetical protein
MKKLIVTLALGGGMVASSYAQGLVNFANTAVSDVYTNSTQNYLGTTLLNGATGLTTGSTTAPNSYYYALLVQTYSGTLVTSTLANVLTSGWTYTGLTAVNALGYGRLGGGISAQTAAGTDAAGVANQFIVVGWSASLGTSWAVVSQLLATEYSSLPTGGYIGISATGTGTGQTTSSETLFGTAGTGILSTIELYSTTQVPEPGTLALAALGGASLLLFRRKK